LPHARIALLERRDPWREPVACAEAVHKGGFHELVDVDSKWVRGPVNGVVFVSPDGTRVKYRQNDSGVILDRACMHLGLAQRCAEEGIDWDFRAQVQSITPRDASGARIVSIKTEEGTRDLIAKAVIDATGAGPHVNQDQGVLPKDHFDVESAVFALVKGIPCEPDFIELYFGQCYAPTGYAWVFPRDEEAANVGVVVGRDHVRTHAPRRMLKSFIERFAPDSEVVLHHGGPIANGQGGGPIADAGLFRVGDAADMVNPISRAGILEAMKAGQLAAGQIAKYLQGNQDESLLYQQYLKDWNAYKGAGHTRLARAKKPFGEIPDLTLDRAAHKLAALEEEKRTLPRIFWATVSTSPILLWKMRSLFWK
jgi:digeranylgeranylglycerophospholipid reductase